MIDEREKGWNIRKDEIERREESIKREKRILDEK